MMLLKPKMAAQSLDQLQDFSLAMTHSISRSQHTGWLTWWWQEVESGRSLQKHPRCVGVRVGAESQAWKQKSRSWASCCSHLLSAVLAREWRDHSRRLDLASPSAYSSWLWTGCILECIPFCGVPVWPKISVTHPLYFALPNTRQ